MAKLQTTDIVQHGENQGHDLENQGQRDSTSKKRLYMIIAS
jgi:hypothetical protein